MSETKLLNRNQAPAEGGAGELTAHWTVACDFDGTISVGDFTDRLLERYAAPAWRTIEEEWRAERIGSRECMLRQIDLVRCTPEQLAALIAESSIDEGFASFVAFLRDCRVPIRVVSDGLDVAIAAILRRHGLQDLPVFANRLTHLGGDRYRITFPNAREDCSAASGMCKCALAAAGPRRARRTLLIGDGASDFCAARSADYVFAKNSLSEFCARENIAFAPFRDFHDVRRLFAALLRDQTVGPLAGAVAKDQESIQHEPR